MPEKTEKVAVRATVEQVVKTYSEAERDIRAGCAAIALAVDTLNARLGETGMWDKTSFGNDGHSRFDFDDPSDQIRAFKRQMWRTLIERLEVRRMLSIERTRKLDEWLSTTNDEITVENVMGIFTAYVAELPDILSEAVGEVYDWLRPRRSELKTNTQYELGERLVIEGCLDGWWIKHNGSPHVSSYREAFFRALDNVFAALDGKGSISKSYYGELGDAINKAKGGKGQTTYFEFRWYKNGNLHMKMRRMDLVAKFNKIAGGRRLKHDNTARRQPEPEPEAA